jgi:hypothetical protein
MKIRNGFVSNSSSSSFIILIKNNTNNPVAFDTFLKMLFGKNKNIPYIRKVISPGYNRFEFSRGEEGSSEYDEMAYLLGDHGKDSRNKFEWYVTQAGDWTGIDADTITWMRPNGADSHYKRMNQQMHDEDEKFIRPYRPAKDMYLPSTDTLDLDRKKKTAKPKPKRKVVKKPVKKCRCKS